MSNISGEQFIIGGDGKRRTRAKPEPEQETLFKPPVPTREQQEQRWSQVRAEFNGMEKGGPPRHYYAMYGDQTSDAERHSAQEVLPGMEMSANDHAKAVAKAVGGTRGWYDYDEGTNFYEPQHRLNVMHKTGATSYISWHPETGEIGMIHSEEPGTARRLHDAARRLSAEHPDMVAPRHSSNRTTAGVRWSRKEMQRHGEEVW
jgi:hypothetical protein